MTVKEIADELGEVPAKVYYHVKKLEAIQVLYVEHTRLVNGIVAKYYDFTTDTFSLSPDSPVGDTTLSSQMTLTYGGYFDEQKQRYFDIADWKFKSGDNGDHDAAFLLKDRVAVDPGKVDELMLKIEDLVKEYRAKDGDGVPYSVFMTMLRYPPQK